MFTKDKLNEEFKSRNINAILIIILLAYQQFS